MQHSIEQSEKAYKTSNKELWGKIHDVGIDSCSSQADSIYFAAEEVHRLVNNYKEQIANLDISGSNTDVAYELISSQDKNSRALITATSKLVYRTSLIAVEDNQQKRMDSLANNIKSVQLHPGQFIESFKHVPSAGALATLSKVQLESSELANISLKSLYRSIETAYPVYLGGDGKLLMEYFEKELSPLLNDCLDNDKDSSPPTTLKMILSINEHGLVRDVVCPQDNISKECKTLLRREVLKMKGWSAPIVSGKPVKSKYNWNVSLSWSE
ncbi:MAG: hypothetical protein EOO85_26020 [Pedobacter sp.]|nr:MAG: hypothetical protein EOO85_26020 [Pedobacter sp.]